MTTGLVPTVRRRGFELGAARSRIVASLTLSGFLVCVWGFYRGPRMSGCSFGRGPESIATHTVNELAFEAFPSWQLAHTDRRCPEQLDQLFEWMNQKDILDPWGRDYRFRCIRAEQATLVVWSAGPDRRHGTPDDIRSGQ